MIQLTWKLTKCMLICVELAMKFRSGMLIWNLESWFGIWNKIDFWVESDPPVHLCYN